MPIINTTYGGNANFEKLLKAKNIINTPAGTIDLFPEDFDGISVLGPQAFYEAAGTSTSPIRRVIMPENDIFASGSSTAQNFFANQNNMIFFFGHPGRAVVYNCKNLKLVIISENKGKVINASACSGLTNLKNMIIATKTFLSLSGSGVTNGKTIYVPDFNNEGMDLVQQYKSATNWSSAQIAPYIHGFSEAPAYEDGYSYSCGDVCQYNDKFYAYWHYDNTVNNAPTGTTDNNDYWFYCGDIEVNS